MIVIVGVVIVCLTILLFVLTALSSARRTRAHLIQMTPDSTAPVHLTAATGDNIVFANSTGDAHSLYLSFEGGALLTLPPQAPGQRMSAIVVADGRIIVRCSFQPLFRMELHVAAPRPGAGSSPPIEGL
ncbi:MAG: hypothetical protein DI534_11050 [Leifsonia xyli]|jgi:hypothetical protein|nr:MAG: hypothetical protein DI534_11050 [Leifsonia xyli]